MKNITIEEIIKKSDGIPTPFIALSREVAVSKAKTLKELSPRFNIYFAVKSLNDREITQAVDKYVEGYDIASAGELDDLLSQNISPERILFSNPVKIPNHIEYAFNKGVNYFAFDSVAEIEKLSLLAPGSNVYLRVRVSDHGSKFPLSQKFGVDPSHVVAFCSTAMDKGLNVCGLAFHVGSQSENPEAWVRAITLSSELIEKLAKTGINIEMLNMGGGFPADYGDPIVSTGEIVEKINTALNDYIDPSIKIIVEPGRYITANAGVIVTTVIGKEQRQGVNWLYVDMGTFQGLIEPLEMPGWKYPVANLDRKGKESIFTLTGPTCDACDTLGSEYSLPDKTDVGDRLLISATGAYTVVYASNFNGFTPPERIYI